MAGNDGKIAPDDKPCKTLTAIIRPKLYSEAIGVKIQSRDVIIMADVNTTFEPYRSDKAPPGICRIM